MGLLSFFRRRTNAADAPTRSLESGDVVAMARTRARRRLMGAAVLVIAGVIGFPLVFETQPRPLPVDIPIEIPRKDGAPVLNMPPARVAAAGKASAPLVASPREEAPTAPAAEAPREVAAPASAAAEKAVPPPPAPAAKKPEAKPQPKPEAKPESKPVAAKPAETKAEPAREGGRFVVQAGAFAEAGAAREMRSKLEKLGLKSYTQVVETSSGSRTRVRAGPYATRDEAERALAKAKAAGVSGVVLTL